MAETARHLDPGQIRPNPENPRMIFREEELLALEESIAAQGILVPLTVYEDGGAFVILDGERRWRCARTLGLTTVPANVQPKPDRLQNIMMMFAIHQARSEWDPLPTALKLDDLREVLAKRYRRQPTEAQLASAASLSVGEVRRYRRILALPEQYKKELLDELRKPRAQQKLTVDHVLETIRGVDALVKPSIIGSGAKESLTVAIIDKFRREVLTSTVEPRLLTNMARAVRDGSLAAGRVRRVVQQLIEDENYSIKEAYANTVEAIDFERGSEQLVGRLSDRLREQFSRTGDVGDEFLDSLRALQKLISAVLKDGRS